MLVINFHPFPQLSGKRIILRRLVPEDVHALYALRADKRVMQYIDRPPAQSIQEAFELMQKINDAFEHQDGISWCLSLKDDPKLIGTIAFWRIMKADHRAEIGYLLQPEFHGKGLMQEALSLVLAYGFKRMQLHSVEAHVNPYNAASIRLLEKNGFLQEAYYKENFYFNGKFLDTAVYSLLTPYKNSVL